MWNSFFDERIDTARLHKSGEETGAGAFLHVDFFRMELRGYDEAATVHFEHFRDAIISRPANYHVPARLMHGLVVEAVDHKGVRAKQLLYAAAGQDIDAMRQVVTRLIALRVMQAIRVKIMDILVERATQGDVQDLHTATHSQRGYVFLQSPGGQLQFDFIKLFVGLIG
jgi:hypothetical protein